MSGKTIRLKVPLKAQNLLEVLACSLVRTKDRNSRVGPPFGGVWTSPVEQRDWKQLERPASGPCFALIREEEVVHCVVAVTIGVPPPPVRLLSLP